MTEIRTKIRALINDLSTSGFEIFEYTNSNIFTISQENITITSVLKNGSELGSGEYYFNTANNKITITVSLTSGDNIEVDYTYYKYSDNELNEYINAALVWISLFSYCSTDYEIENGEIFPTPDNKTKDLMSLIASILIKPNYSEYRLPNLIVKYPRRFDKDEKIENIIRRFQIGIGSMDIIEWD